MRRANLSGAIIFSTIFSAVVGGGSVFATASSLTISVADSVALNIVPGSSTGTFATSDTSTSNVSVKTTNGTGYTLGIKAGTNGVNSLSTAGGATIPSITTSISESTYSTSATYNNTWGYRPSKLNSAANSNYLQAPTSSSTITTLDQTTVSNASVANTYNLAIGARLTATTASGTYSNTMVLTVVANPAVYSITYNANGGSDTVTNMPSNVSNQTTSSETVNISSTVPVRSDYSFKGWCTVQVADGGSCTGTTYNPNGGGTNLAWSIDQTLAANTLALYAMWGSSVANTTCSTSVPGITYMQELADSTKKSTALSSMTTGSQYYLIDERDNQGYCVAKQADGNIWMTQNLDLDINGTNTATLTSENTDLNSSGSGAYSSGYTKSGSVITWTPASTATTSGRTISGTTVSGSWSDSNTAPYSVEGGDRYYYTSGSTNNETAQTLAQCISSHTEEECAHYHVGNYYNWTAAIASNNSSSISANYATASNSICPKGWKIPQGKASSNSNSTRQFGYLWQQAGVTSSLTATSYATNGFNKIRATPLFFVRGGIVSGGSSGAGLGGSGSYGYYWSNTANKSNYAFGAYFYSSGIDSSLTGYGRYYAESVRCMIR